MTIAPTNFHDRITRINSGTQWDCEGVVTEKVRGRRKGASRNNPVTLVFGLVLGVLLIVVARAVRFHLLPETALGGGAHLQEALVIDVALASWVVLAMAFRRRWRSILGSVGRMAGVMLGALAMHVTVHAAPDIWALAFSSAWVQDVLANTQASSLLNISPPKL